MSRWLVGAVLVAATAVPVGLPTAACAGPGDRAALVVDTGSAVHSYCVALPDDSVTGTELIVLAAEQHGLSYRFGYGGDAVCMLAGVGTSGDDCFERYPDFWGYWRGDGSGGWSWSGSGAGSTRVSDGDVEGWSWGSGSDGRSHPAPPRTTFASVCPVAAPEPAEREPERDPESRKPDRAGAGREEPSAAAPAAVPSAPASADDGPGRDARPRSARRPRVERRDVLNGVADRTRTNGPVETADVFDDERPVAATGTDPSPPGPPVAGLAALAAAGTLGGLGSWLARRRRRERA